MGKSRVFGILSGVFLLAFALPVALIYGVFIGFDFQASRVDFSDLYPLVAAVLLITAGILMILGKSKTPALIVLAVAVIYAFYSFPQAVSYLGGSIEQFERPVAIPKYFAIYPISAILSLLLFAATLRLNGKTSLIIAILSAVLGIVAFVFHLRTFNYISGHPTPANLLTINILISEIFAGLFKKQAG